jgi:hypothetical protein
MQVHVAAGMGSKDGLGSGDHDQAYMFGRRPRAIAPFPFTPRQFGRLLALRGRIADGLIGSDDLDAAEDSLAEALQAHGGVAEALQARDGLAEALQAQHDTFYD